MAAPYGVYVHVPWCRHVCPYCDFNVHASSAPPEADDLAAYVAELAALPELTGLARDGLVQIDARCLRLTRRGLRFADTVSALLV